MSRYSPVLAGICWFHSFCFAITLPRRLACMSSCQKDTVQHVLAEFVLDPVKCVFGWVGTRERMRDLEIAHVAHSMLW